MFLLAILIFSALALAVPISDIATMFLPGVVTVFTERNFSGNATIANAANRCSQTFDSGAIKSLKQEAGALCWYYRDPGCVLANHVPILKHDSKDGKAWEAMELGEWEGKIRSLICKDQ